jgi:hypothetical protein
MKKKRMMICTLNTVTLQWGKLKLKGHEKLKMKRHQMGLVMIFVGPSLMHTEKQKV